MPTMVIRRDSELHKKLLRAVLSRKNFSYSRMSQLRSRLNKADETFKAFIPETELSSKRKRERDNEAKFDFVNIKIPYSYAVLMTVHTFWSTVFLSRTPVFQYTARHGEPQNAVQAVEAIMDYQLRVGEMLGPLYIWLFDMAKWPFSVLGTFWDEEIIQVSEIVEEPVTLLGVDVGKTRKVKRIRRLPGYVGNRVFNVRPHDFFPDVRVPLSRLQDGEYCGREVRVGWNQIVKGEKQGKYFNIDVLKNLSRDREKREGSRSEELPEGSSYRPLDMSVEPVKLLEMIIELIPKDWELGSSDFPEKWVFTVAEDSIIIGAEPQGSIHAKFPFVVQEFSLGNDELFKPSLMELTQPLNSTMEWLINTHFWNIRKALNDVRIVDPSRIVLSDLLEPLPGNIVRLKPEFYGTDSRLAVHQLQVQDITQTNLRDLNIVETLVQRLTGAVDNLMGLVNPSGRKTATEVRTASGFSMNRLKTIAEYNSATVWAPLSQMMVKNTQQFYDTELKLRLIGNLANEADSFLTVRPEDISGFFDFVPVDGTLPVDRLAQANFWRELLQSLARVPQLAGQFDLAKIATHTMNLLGEKNVDSFRVQVIPDEEVQQDAARGNIVPIGPTANPVAGSPAASVNLSTILRQ